MHSSTLPSSDSPHTFWVNLPRGVIISNRLVTPVATPPPPPPAPPVGGAVGVESVNSVLVSVKVLVSVVDSA